MRRTIALAAVAACLGAAFADEKPAAQAPAGPDAAAKEEGVLGFTMKDIDGKDAKLSDYKGKVLLMVNVASKCGLTPQYKDLQAAYEKYKEKGLVVLGFPANEFGAQEPGTNAQISEFCTRNYGVQFDMFSKIVVKGSGQAPLYKFLTTQPKFRGEVAWNFEKFLIGRNGEVVARFLSEVEPLSAKMTQAIENALNH